jgi:hypothetical protein
MRRFGVLGLCLAALVGLAFLATGQMTACADEKATEKATEKAAEHGFVGATSCKMCHKKPEKGEQYPKWLAGPHAHAYKSLLTDQSKAICKEMGIAEAPEEADKCLKCHVTGHGAKAELLGKKYDKTEGVTCESCHGPAADWKKPHMKDPAKAMTLGMIVPTDEKMCKTCHNEESPTYKPFVYKEKLAKIAHPNPKKAEG